MDEKRRQGESRLPEASEQNAPDAAIAGATPSAPLTDQRTDEPRRLSRRMFLGGALTGAAAAVAAACGGGNDPTPSPLNTPSPLQTPTRMPAEYKNYLPWISKESTLSPGMLPPEPTLTPTPTKTPKPKPPTPTPTPQATPFPPGPPSKLGVFVGYNDPQLFELLSTQGVAVVKTLELDANFLAQIKQTSPKTKIVARVDFPQLDLASFDPLAAAQEYLNRIIGYAEDERRRPYIDGWESVNEPVAVSAEEMRRLAEYEAERTRLLGDRGLRSVIGNFGTGQPPLELWPEFFPALRVAQQYDGWLGLHEYSAPTMYYLTSVEGNGRYPGVTPQDSGWLTLRYRKVYQEILAPAGLVIPLVMTELGVDGLVEPRPGPPDARGWTEFQSFWAENGYGLWGPGAYVEQLVWYDNAMRENDYVIGGAIFALAPTAGWDTYDIRGQCAAVLQQYLSVHAAA